MLDAGSHRQSACEGAAMRLSREQVLSTALDLLDEVGLEHLNMPRRAAALGVQNGATYWHFHSKQALLEAMADTLLTGLTAGLDAEAPWAARITATRRRRRRA